MESRTYRELQRAATRRLQRSGCENAHFAAMNLMTYCFELERSDLILHSDEIPPAQRVTSFMEAVKQCAEGEPLQYILGEWEFMGLPFAVGPGVLIPRPETELLVDCALRLLRHRGKKAPVVFDLCTGSGAVALSIAKFWPEARVYAVELSEDALEYAKKNKELNGGAAVTLIKGDVLQGFEAFSFPQADLLLSNPPYINTGEIASLQREVQREPHMALNGGEDGLMFYRAIRDKWLPFLAPDGAMAVECGNEQGAALTELFQGLFSKGGIKRDYSGLDRVFWGVL